MQKRRRCARTRTFADHLLTIRVDDSVTVYADGVERGRNIRASQETRMTISSDTQILSLIAVDRGGNKGIIAELSNGIVTDTTWKCVTEEPETNGKSEEKRDQISNKVFNIIEMC